VVEKVFIINNSEKVLWYSVKLLSVKSDMLLNKR
jgi:hypothetical protein